MKNFDFAQIYNQVYPANSLQGEIQYESWKYALIVFL